jgi:flavin-dependent dehydrogenase
MTGDADAVIIGAGPAGSAAATLLATEGFRTVMLEAATLPRSKVCGAFLSADASSVLRTLGVAEEVKRIGPERISAGSLHLPSGFSVPFDLPAPGIGISRFALDHLLAKRAARAGAVVHFRARVSRVERTRAGFRLRLASGESLMARVAIGAWGRWNSLDRSLGRPFPGRRPRYLGWSGEYRGDGMRLKGSVRLYAFEGGYCGLSLVEGGRVNLAGVIAADLQRRLGSGWEEVVAHARRSNLHLARHLDGLSPIGFQGTGPVFFTARRPTENGILLVGDAAGVLDPFSGQGQAAALSSGVLAAGCAAAFLSSRLADEELLRRYAAAWRGLFSGRFAWSSAFRHFMLLPWLGEVAGRIAGSSATRLAVRALAKPRSPSSSEAGQEAATL